MALSEDNQNWVREQIRQSFHPNGWKKVADQLRYWGLLAVVITAFLGLVAIVITLTIFATNKVAVESEFRGKTAERLASIEDRLTSVETSLKLLPAQLAVTKFSSISPKELKDHRDELNQLRSSLTTAPSVAPGYWNTAFQVIQLASRSTFDAKNSEKIFSGQESVFRNVTSKPLGALAVAPNQRAVLKDHIEGLIFRDSIIRFDPSVELVNDVFINCIFIFPVLQTPPQPLQRIAAELLSSDLSNVTLNPS
jgi:hypothetical protein